MFGLTDNQSTYYCSHMATLDNYMAFIECLKTAIALSGCTRKEIAQKAGIHISTLNRITSGQRDASVKTLFALAQATNTNPIRLIDGSLCKECLKS